MRFPRPEGTIANLKAATLVIVGIICTGCLGLKAQEPAKAPKQEPQIVLSQPSLAEIAREQQARQAKEENVPLYTNDNLPTRSGGLGIAGPSAPETTGNERAGFAEEVSPETVQQIAFLRGKLSRLQQHLAMHQRELSVLQQQLNQAQMQYYPNPYETLTQEYSRADINKGTSAVNGKKEQIEEDQKNIEDVQHQLQRLAWLNPAAAASAQSAESKIPPGLKPGTKPYWQARFQAVRQQLRTAMEEQKLSENELNLLKLQQLRTLNPNLQSELTAQIVAKQQEVATDKEAVGKAHAELDQLQKELQGSGSPAEWAK